MTNTIESDCISFSAKIYTHIALLFCILFLAPSIGFGQSSVSIMVKGENNEPVDISTVFVTTTDTVIIKSAYTDSLGIAKIQDIENGEYLLMIKSAEYHDTSVYFNLEKDVDLGSISLRSKVTTFDGVTVVYERPIIETRGDMIIINVDKTILKGSGTVYDLIGKLPGMTYNSQGVIMFQGRPGIRVRIDRRNLRLSGSDLTNYLLSLSSDDVDKVEILHTPGATEDAEGSSAILNIITIKGKKLGLNGGISGGLTYGRTFRGNLGANFNYRPTQKLNIYGNYSISPGNFTSQYENNRSIPTTGVRIEENIDNRMNWLGHVGKLGLDYTINSKSSFGVIGNINLTNDNTTFTSDINNFIGEVADTLIDFDGDTKDSWQEYSGSIFYNRSLDTLGSSLEILGDFVYFNTQSVSELTSTFSFNDQIVSEDYRKNTNPSIIKIGSLKADVSKQLKHGRLNFGAKASMASTDNDFVALVSTGSGLVNDDTRTNHFLFDEQIYAVYGQYNVKLKDYEMSIGLRPEYSELQGNSLTLDSVFERSVFAFFPSFSVAKPFGKNHRLSFSYSRRLNRPNYSDLNPFEVYLTNYSFWRGNPDLRPQFAQNLSISHSFKYKIWTTLSYSHTTNMFMPTIFQNDVTKQFYTTQTNFGESHFVGLFIYSAHQIKPWWNIVNNGGVYYSQLLDKRSSDASVTVFEGVQGYYVNVTNTFSLKKNFSIELAARYNGPGKGLWESNANFSIDVGAKKRFKNNAVISLQVTNALNTIKYVNTYNYENVNYQSRYIPELRTVRLSFSYPFGKANVESAKEHQAGAEDEKNRVTKN